MSPQDFKAFLQMGFVLLNSLSLQDRLEIQWLMLSGSCLMILGGWLDLVLMYSGWSLGFL